MIVRNLTLQSATEAVSLASGLLVTLVLSRHLGVAGFGQFNYLFAFLYFFLAVNDLGVNTIVVREISQAPARAGEIIGSLLSFRLALGTLSLLVLWAIVFAVDFSTELRVALALIGFVLPLNALRLPVVIFQSRLRFDYAAAVEISNRLATAALVLGAVALDAGLIGVTSALLAGDLIGVGATCLFSRRLVRPAWRIEPAYWRVVLRWSLPLGMAGVLSAVVNRVDFLMLERMADMHQLGLYGAAYKLTGLVERLPQMVVATLYPLMARQALENPRALGALYRKGLLTLAGLAIAMAVSMTLLGTPIIRIVFGEQYGDAVRALRILVWASACLYVALPGGFALISLGRVRLNLLTLVAGAATNIALNVVLIPRFGYIGAAAATVAAFAVILATTIVAVEWSINRAVADVPRGAPAAAVVTPPIPGAATLE
jgi:O-antigen/teichoic acid export membrane protein